MERIFNQFPRWQREIEQLHQENADFQETCRDYEELHSLLAIWTAPTGADPATLDGYRTLLKALEAEILECLQARFQHIERSAQDDVDSGGEGVDP